MYASARLAHTTLPVLAFSPSEKKDCERRRNCMRASVHVSILTIVRSFVLPMIPNSACSASGTLRPQQVRREEARLACVESVIRLFNEIFAPPSTRKLVDVISKTAAKRNQHERGSRSPFHLHLACPSWYTYIGTMARGIHNTARKHVRGSKLTSLYPLIVD